MTENVDTCGRCFSLRYDGGYGWRRISIEVNSIFGELAVRIRYAVMRKNILEMQARREFFILCGFSEMRDFGPKIVIMCNAQ